MVFLLSAPAVAQTIQPPTVTDTMGIHEMPVFRGGIDRLHSIITENLEYPRAAKKDGVGGRVVVGFTVDTSGSISDIQILEGVRADIDQEALRLVGLLKKWNPGRIDGKPVRVKYELPLTFSLKPQRKKMEKTKKQSQ